MLPRVLFLEGRRVFCPGVCLFLHLQSVLELLGEVRLQTVKKLRRYSRLDPTDAENNGGGNRRVEAEAASKTGQRNGGDSTMTLTTATSGDSDTPTTIANDHDRQGGGGASLAR